MLCFNPINRASPYQLLKASVFDDIRDENMERAAPWKASIADFIYDLDPREPVV